MSSKAACRRLCGAIGTRPRGIGFRSGRRLFVVVGRGLSGRIARRRPDRAAWLSGGAPAGLCGADADGAQDRHLRPSGRRPAGLARHHRQDRRRAAGRRRLHAESRALSPRRRISGTAEAPTPTPTPTSTASGPAPQSLHVSGNKLVNASGQPVLLHGVDRSGTEYACVQGNGIFDGPNDQASITAMKNWGVNAVRVPLRVCSTIKLDLSERTILIETNHRWR